ncbi:MAG: SIR2 family protein [Bacteroidota bacterium]
MPLQDSNLELCVNYLSEGKCILFLGPQFAMDQEQKKIHENIRTHLQSSLFNDKLDFHYDNLYIFSQPKPRTGDKMRLHIELKKQYQKTEPHEIYDKLAEIPFSAVISCSADGFLKEAYERKEKPLHFCYFSRKGGTSEEPPELDMPILYNVFGYVGDEDSLITTYESFFRFIISMMGDEQQMPLELRNRIVEAKIFVFMGFDFSRWYIPLLVHKLTSFKGDDDSTTALVDQGNKLDEKSVSFYPIEMLVLDGESVNTVDQLHTRLQSPEYQEQAAMAPKTDPIKEVKTLLTQDKLEESITMLKGVYKQHSLEDDDIIMLEARLMRYNNNLALEMISLAEGAVEKAKITQAVLYIIKDLADEIDA